MRLFGYILLIGGFVAINWEMMAARDIIYGACRDLEEQMAQQQFYTRDDVRIAMVNAANATWQRTAPWFVKPGLAMLIGSFLLDRAARQKKVSDDPAKITTVSKQPTTK
jgi:hypothetical protein